MQFVKGPDFTNWRVLIEPSNQIRDAYATGRGGFRVRANGIEIEKGGLADCRH